MKHKTSISHDQAMVKELRERPDFAAEYLKAAMEDLEEPGVLLVALRRVAEARGGVAKVAKAAGVERESLYRALSTRGNPRWSTLLPMVESSDQFPVRRWPERRVANNDFAPEAMKHLSEHKIPSSRFMHDLLLPVPGSL